MAAGTACVEMRVRAECGASAGGGQRRKGRFPNPRQPPHQARPLPDGRTAAASATADRPTAVLTGGGELPQLPHCQGDQKPLHRGEILRSAPPPRPLPHPTHPRRTHRPLQLPAPLPTPRTAHLLPLRRGWA